MPEKTSHVESSTASGHSVSTAAATLPPPVMPSFDERWAAWQARGAAHDRAVRRRFGIATPVMALLAAAILYALVGR